MDKKIKLGIIISTISLVEQVRKFASEHNENIQFAYKGLDEAIPAGKEMEAAGVEVIISRRGTAHLLRENLHIPVLSIPLASLNILDCLRRAAALGKKILLTTFHNETSGIEIMEELLGIKVFQGIYYNSATLEKVIHFGQKQGYEVAVGGGLTMRFAKQYGLQGVEFETSEEIIAATIENAKSVAQANREEQEKAQRYHCIIDAASEGIIAVDENGRITTINKTAKKLLKINDYDMLGKHITQCISNPSIIQILKTQEAAHDKLEKVNNELFVFNHLPVMMGSKIIGGVSTFKDISNVMRAENKVRRSLSKGLIAKYFIGDLIHQSAAMRDVVNMAKQFAKTDSTILIMGATGTGKEVLAQSMHNLSRRAKSPFLSINCAALPDQLLESELFGYEEGAFTGSKKGGKPGCFEIAHKGTIFLDEIDTTPQNVQIRLLRVLQEREVMRIGADRKIPVDVRVISAANKDLGAEVHNGSFREDLFFRLNVLHINIPPLRERSEDIPVLVDYFIQDISKKHGLEPIALPKSYIYKLMEYSWPGNVRQLKNFFERLVLICNLRCSLETLDELFSELIQYSPSPEKPHEQMTQVSLKEQLEMHKIDNETKVIRKALEEAYFNKTNAAKILGISRTTLWRKLKMVGLE
jgi:PAS domain S-box-containing protein